VDGKPSVNICENKIKALHFVCICKLYKVTKIPEELIKVYRDNTTRIKQNGQCLIIHRTYVSVFLNDITFRNS